MSMMSLAAADAAAPASNRPALSTLIRGPFGFGLIVVLLFFVGLGGWLMIAPLSSAAIAPGIVSPESARQTVQHLEGGIVREMNVTEGDLVEPGQLLATLEPTRARAEFGARERQWVRLSAIRQRLEAHQAGAEALSYSGEIAAVDDPDLAAFRDNQLSLFRTHLESLDQQENIYELQIIQLGQEAAALDRENAGRKRQLEILEEELADKDVLMKQSLVRKPEIFALQRAAAEIDAEIAANDAEAAQARAKIEETKLAILQLHSQFLDRTADQLMRINSEIAQLEQGMIASRDVLTRTQIMSPVAGIVLNVRFKTPGAVVKPGEAILDIVPVGEELVINAELAPTDIDVVHPGLGARVHLLPYVSRYTPNIEGKVTKVSADTKVDEKSGRRFYEVRVEVPKEEIAKIPNIELTPGMPAEVLILTGQRTAFEYITEPIVRSFRRAFRED
ncbi:HlyD family type I secretion periplasmic adaptor subunit [Tepidamorphus sp. 3E244]|uniref:HlyD family type I secretion periplasmic adaptor subunit n=1 Tax=Tepidamorphus sp. 3E244 TaxID=3385498 RepID=UPI0038FC96DF